MRRSDCRPLPLRRHEVHRFAIARATAWDFVLAVSAYELSWGYPLERIDCIGVRREGLCLRILSLEGISCMLIACYQTLELEYFVDGAVDERPCIYVPGPLARI